MRSTVITEWASVRAMMSWNYVLTWFGATVHVSAGSDARSSREHVRSLPQGGRYDPRTAWHRTVAVRAFVLLGAQAYLVRQAGVVSDALAVKRRLVEHDCSKCDQSSLLREEILHVRLVCEPCAVSINKKAQLSLEKTRYSLYSSCCNTNLYGHPGSLILILSARVYATSY